MRVFFDTSAFVKRYIEEPGTDKVVDICIQASRIKRLDRVEKEKRLQRGKLPDMTPNALLSV
jgi:hypothetical protein